MADLPGAPPPVPYLQRDRGSLDALVETFGWLPVAGMVLAASGLFSFVVGDEIAGPAGELWVGILWLAGAILWCIYLYRRFGRREPRGGPAWERDRAWGRDAEVRSPWQRCSLRGVSFLAAWTLFSAWMVMRRNGVMSPSIYIAAGCGVFVAVAMTRAWLQGGVEVRWPEFPTRTGMRARFHVATTAGGTSVPVLSVALRCVASRRGEGGSQSEASIVSELPCATPGPLAAGPDEFVTVEFDVPADAPGTDLSRRGDERYWELVVLGTTAWGKIAETFVVPIYAADADVPA
jgi:hypothetical protein